MNINPKIKIKKYKITKESITLLIIFILQMTCFLSDIIVGKIYYALVLLSGLIIILCYKFKMVSRVWIGWASVYILLITFNYFWSVSPTDTFTYLRNTIIRLSIVFVLCSAFINVRILKASIKMYSIIGLLTSIYVIYVERSTEWLGKQVFGGTVISFTYILLPALMATMYCIIENEYKSRLFGVCNLIFLLMVSSFTTSRKNILLAVAFLILFLALKNGKNVMKFLIIMLVGGIVIFMAVNFLISKGIVPELMIERFESFIQYIISGGEDQSLLIRNGMIGRALELFKEKPLIGQGFDSFKRIGGFGVYAHNNYLELLSGGGIIALIIYYSIYIYGIIKLRTVKCGYGRFFFVALVVYLMEDYGCVSNFVFPQIFIVAQAMCALKIYTEEIKK